MRQFVVSHWTFYQLKKIVFRGTRQHAGDFIPMTNLWCGCKYLLGGFHPIPESNQWNALSSLFSCSFNPSRFWISSTSLNIFCLSLILIIYKEIISEIIKVKKIIWLEYAETYNKHVDVDPYLEKIKCTIHNFLNHEKHLENNKTN